MSITTTNPVTAPSSETGSDGNQKDLLGFLNTILPGAAETVAPNLGIDIHPGVIGQTVSQVLDIFGIGRGKAFTPAVTKEQAVSQLQQALTPYLSDPDFMQALAAWLRAAIEPVQAQKELSLIHI